MEQKSVNKIEELLLRYNVVHSSRVENLYTYEAHIIDEAYGKEFLQSARDIHELVMRVIGGINEEFCDFKAYIPDFPFKDEILSMKSPLEDFLWTRYDGFLKEEGLFYSEFNYDKPCAERECALMEEKIQGAVNLTEGFMKKLKANLLEILNRHFPNNEKHNIAFLTAPSRYEETHLALFLKEYFEKKDKVLQNRPNNLENIGDKEEKISVTLVGPTNLYVEEGSLKAFNKDIDVIIRLYPTEFMYECPAFREMLELHEQGKILILNDPRAILAQCKGLYAYLWNIVKKDDERINSNEKTLITKYLPYTEILNKNNLEKARKFKDSYVVKPVFGRYSIDVFIGNLHSQEQWDKCMNYVEESMNNNMFILQSFEKIKEETTIYDDGIFKKQREAFGNYGIFISMGEAIGSCIRWCPDYITEEENTWISPVASGVKNIRAYDMLKNEGQYKEVISEKETSKENIVKIKIDKIEARAVIEHGFSGLYAKNYQYLSVNPLLIKEEKLKELETTTEALAKIFNKTQRAIRENIDAFEDILCLKGLAHSLKKETSQEFCFLGRMDWIIDKWGNLKVLEINSETPAGVLEAIELQKEYLEIFMEGHKKEVLINPNNNLKALIKSQARKIINECTKIKEIKNIAIVGATYYEDWYTMKGIYQLLKEEFSEEINIIMGNIEDLVLEGEEIYLYGQKLDAIYRYYPLDWFKECENLKNILEKFNENIFSLNPVSTIISQSKGLFPSIYELMKYKFYTPEEEELITKYIPLTVYNYRDLESLDFVVKPMLGREGAGVEISHELNAICEEDVVFQQLVYPETLRVNVTSNLESFKENLYPVIGAYVVGDKFGGVFTRLGGKITGNICMYAPLFGEKGDE